MSRNLPAPDPSRYGSYDSRTNVSATRRPQMLGQTTGGPMYNAHFLRSQDTHSAATGLLQLGVSHGHDVQGGQAISQHAAYPPVRYSDYSIFDQSTAPQISGPGTSTGPSNLLSGPILSSSEGAATTKPPTKVACVNCKKAHVRCDERKPCDRCRTNNIECQPAVQKRRGRPPQYREQPGDGTQFAEQPPRRRRGTTCRDSGTFQSYSTGITPAVSAPEAPSIFGASQLPPLSSQAGQQPNGMHISGVPEEPSETINPMAFLDIYFVVMRVNESFQNAFGSSSSLIGRQLASLVENGFQSLLDDVRKILWHELRFHEPQSRQYLKIDNEGHRANIPTVEPAGIPEWVGPFTEQRTNLRIHFAVGSIAMTVSFRLAKADIFFIVLTLPDRQNRLPLIPMIGPPPPMVQQGTLVAGHNHHLQLVPFGAAGSPHGSNSAPASPLWSSQAPPVNRQVYATHSPLPHSTMSHQQPHQPGHPYASLYSDPSYALQQPARLGYGPLTRQYTDVQHLAPGEHNPRRPRSAELAHVRSAELAQARSRLMQPRFPTVATTYASMPPNMGESSVERPAKRSRDSPPVGSIEHVARRRRGQD